MAASRTSYDDLGTPASMREDCAAVGRRLGLPTGLERLDRIARAAVAGPPSLEYDDYPHDLPKREVEVSEAAARVAGALHLHLD